MSRTFWACQKSEIQIFLSSGERKVKVEYIHTQRRWLIAWVLGWTISPQNSDVDTLTPDALEYVSTLDTASYPPIPPHPRCFRLNPGTCSWAPHYWDIWGGHFQRGHKVTTRPSEGLLIQLDGFSYRMREFGH